MRSRLLVSGAIAMLMIAAVFPLVVRAQGPDVEPVEKGTLTYGETVSATLADGTNDHWSFAADAGDTIAVALASADFDTIVELRNANRVLLAENDDDPDASGTDSRIGEYRILVEGTYTVVVRPWAMMAAGGDYTLVVERLSTDDTPFPTLRYDEPANGTLGGDEIYWAFEAKAGDVISIAIESELDTVLTLYNPFGAPLTEDDDSGDFYNAQIASYRIPARGTYLVRPSSYSGTDTGPYTLTLSLEASDVAPERSLAAGEPVTAELEASGAQEWAFSGSVGDVVTVEMASDSFDAYLELRNPYGGVVASDDDSGDGTNPAIIEFSLPMDGTYYVTARTWANVGSGSYTLTLTGTLTPPQ